MRGLADKRHHSARMKRKYRLIFEPIMWDRNHWPYLHGPMSRREVGILSRTPKPQSCFCCSNKRRNHGPTFQERKQLTGDLYGQA